MRLHVDAVQTLGGAPRSLGRLGPALTWLASVQGAWPPRTPVAARSLVAADDGTLASGIAAADALADGGCELLLVGADGDPVPGLVVVAALLDLEPVRAVGTAAGEDWAALTTGVRDGLRTARVHVGDPEGLLGAVGSGALAHLTGVLAQSAVRRTPVVLDGSAVTAAAAVLADRLAPGSAAWQLAGQVPPAPAARLGLQDVGLTGLLDLGLALPAGARLAWSLVEQALPLVQEPPGG